jgi:hypothetical protein
MDNNNETPSSLFANIEINLRNAMTNSLRDYLTDPSNATNIPQFTRAPLSPRHVPANRHSRHIPAMRSPRYPMQRRYRTVPALSNPPNILTSSNRQIDTHTINLLREMVRVNTSVMNSYGNAITEYNQNMREISQLIRLLSISNSTRPPSSINNEVGSGMNIPATPVNTRNANDFFSFLFTESNNSGTLFTPEFNNVVIYPTDDQIENATEVFEYLDTMVLSNNRCPITLGDFQVGDIVRRINQCGHCFQTESLLVWFRANVACPMCRYDIRDYIEPVNNNNNEDDDDINNNEDDDINNNDDDDDDDNPLQYPYTSSFTFTDASHNNETMHSTNTVTLDTFTTPTPTPTPTPNTEHDTTNIFGNSIQNILMAALNEGLSGVSMTTMPNNDISNASLVRMAIPVDYEEYYDASNNLLARRLL